MAVVTNDRSVRGRTTTESIVVSLSAGLLAEVREGPSGRVGGAVSGRRVVPRREPVRRGLPRASARMSLDEGPHGAVTLSAPPQRPAPERGATTDRCRWSIPRTDSGPGILRFRWAVFWIWLLIGCAFEVLAAQGNGALALVEVHAISLDDSSRISGISASESGNLIAWSHHTGVLFLGRSNEWTIVRHPKVTAPVAAVIGDSSVQVVDGTQNAIITLSYDGSHVLGVSEIAWDGTIESAVHAGGGWVVGGRSALGQGFTVLRIAPESGQTREKMLDGTYWAGMGLWLEPSGFPRGCDSCG